MSSLEKRSLTNGVSKAFNPLSCSQKKRVDKFYRQQSNLLENFEKDSKQIQNFQGKKSSQNLCEDDPTVTLLESTAIDNIPEPMLLDVGDDAANKLLPVKDEVIAVNETKSQLVCSPRINLVGEKNAYSSLPSITTRHLALITLLINVLLTIAKGFASYLSGSLSIISSLVDSLVDITSGLVIWMTNRAIRKHDPYLYPVGRTRLEPIALVIVSVIMAVASVQMVLQSFQSVINNQINPHVDLITFCIMVATIIIKLILFLCCYRLNDPSVKVLALDHRNDCLSNLIALICAFCAQKFWVYLDPIGAILVAIYIAVTWFRTGREQLIMLSGRSAGPEFINRIIKLCIDHDKRIDFIDTVYVYHFGIQFLVEVHIVLDENMRLKKAHDISETLQMRIESLPEVERAFVHVDYEFDHKPGDEHKLP